MCRPGRTCGPAPAPRAQVGFTLIELLVVVAIIAVLAAIIFPVFAKARDRGRQTACLSNIRQILMGVAQYTQDHDRQLPGSWAVGTSGLWSRRIQPYCRSAKLFECPSGRRFSAWGGWDWPGTPKTMYGYNCNISRKGLCTGAHSLALFKYPSEAILIGDLLNSNWDMVTLGGADGRINPVGDPACWNGVSRCPLATWPEPSRVHNGGANYGYLDGHAKWRKPELIYPTAPDDASKDRCWGAN